MTFRRIIASLVLISLILGFSGAFASYLYSNKPTVEEKTIEIQPLNVDVFELAPIDFRELLTGFGNSRAEVEVIIAAQVTGEIEQLLPKLKTGIAVQAVGVGSTPEGPSATRDADLLLKIDARDYQQKVDIAANRIEEAKTDIARLKVKKISLARQQDKSAAVLKSLNEEYERLKRGIERKVTTPSELNKARIEVQRYEDTIIQLENQIAALPYELEAAEQRLGSAQTEKKRAEHDVQRTVVTPPFDGVVGDVYVEQGQFVSTGEKLFRLIDLTRVEVPVPLAFEDFLLLQEQLAAGERPTVSIARNETAKSRWRGHVVRTAPEADSQSRTMLAFIEVENKPSMPPLIPGAFVHARIDGKTYQSAILIPRDAVVNDAVYVVGDGNKASRKSVTVGRRFQSFVLLESGLAAGERVILTNLDIVEEGRELVVQNTLNPREEIKRVRNSVIRLTDSVP